MPVAEFKKVATIKRENKSVAEKILPLDLVEAIKDTRERKNLYDPFKTAEEAVKSMLED